MRHFLFCCLLIGELYSPSHVLAEDLPSVKVLKVSLSELYESYFYPVVLEARQESEISSEIDGIVKELKVKIGQSVQAGQVLMLLQQSKPGFSFAPFPIKSSITGTVAAVFKKSGSSVKTGDPLVQVVNHDELSLKFEIPEAELSLLKAGLSGEVRFKQAESPFPILISGISPILNLATGTASGELVWDDKKADTHKLRKSFLPGMVGRASFKINFRKGLSIPKLAVFFEKQSYAVRLVQGDKIVKKSIKIGKEHTDQVEILDGLKEGDLVVISRNKYLKDGETVKVDKEEP